MKFVKFEDIHYQAASHEDPKNPGVLKKIMLTANELIAGQVQMLNWALLEPQKSFNLHYHQDMDEVFIITQGTAEMTVNNNTVTMNPGDCILVEANEQHSMKNTTNTPVQYIVFGISRNQNGKTINV